MTFVGNILEVFAKYNICDVSACDGIGTTAGPVGLRSEQPIRSIQPVAQTRRYDDGMSDYGSVVSGIEQPMRSTQPIQPVAQTRRYDDGMSDYGSVVSGIEQGMKKEEYTIKANSQPQDDNMSDYGSVTTFVG